MVSRCGIPCPGLRAGRIERKLSSQDGTGRHSRIRDPGADYARVESRMDFRVDCPIQLLMPGKKRELYTCLNDRFRLPVPHGGRITDGFRKPNHIDGQHVAGYQDPDTQRPGTSIPGPVSADGLSEAAAEGMRMAFR